MVDVSLVGTAVATLLLVFVLLKVWKGYTASKAIENKLSKIPLIAGGLPFLGHILEMLKGPPWDIMSDWVLTKGPIIRFKFFFGNFVAINDHNMIKHVFNTNFRNYRKDLDTYGPFLCLLGTGLVTSEGDLWKRQRDLISPAFRVEILEDATRIAKEASDRLSEKLEKVRGTGEVVEIAEEFRKLTLQVIGEAVLSMTAEESNKVFPELYLPIVEEANLRTWYPYRPYLPTRANFRYMRAVYELNTFVTDMIKRRRAEFLKGDRKDDILDRILDANKDGKWDNAAIIQLRDEIKTFLFAGHETSSTMMTWTLYELTQNPDCLEKAMAEARSLLTDNGDLPPFETCKDGFNYIVNCEKEALRKYSIVPVVTRVAAADDKIGEYDIPAGTRIAIPIQAVHHDPTTWPNPDSFDPERFTEAFPTYAWLPFIAGPRSCVGQYFSLLETKLVLALLIHRFKFTPAPGNVGTRHPSMVPVASIDNMRMTID